MGVVTMTDCLNSKLVSQMPLVRHRVLDAAVLIISIACARTRILDKPCETALMNHVHRVQTDHQSLILQSILQTYVYRNVTAI